MSHYLLDGWLQGTTCHQKSKRSVMFENETHIVLKHSSHREYCGRGQGNQTCTSYARLYTKAALEAALKDRSYGGLFACHVKEWTGRINPRVVREQCEKLGIYFP